MSSHQVAHARAARTGCRAALLAMLVIGLGALEYAPQLDAVRFYRFTTTQAVAWSSAGDDLRYDTRLVWRLALRAAAVDGPRVTLAATYIQVEAEHRGPGIEVRLDSTTGAGADDPLLGHLVALAGTTLTLEVERDSGRVLTATGGDTLVAAINRRARPAMPGDPPPLDAQARALYGDQALAAQWSRVLALPGQASEMTLPAPFTAGAVVRAWEGSTWTATLPAGDPPLFELARDPAPVRGRLTTLAGSGSVALNGGLPGRITGRMVCTIDLDALTQPVATRHELAWTLETVD